MSYSEIAKEAYKVEYFSSVIDVNDNCFSNPENMISEIENVCRKTNQPVPEKIGELANCIYSSLAKSYEKELKHIEEIKENKTEYRYIVSGGSNVETLNQLIANLTKNVVFVRLKEQLFF